MTIYTEREKRGVMKRLTSVQHVIDQFGSVKALAAWAHVGESAVCNWVSRGYIPPGWSFRLQHHLQDCVLDPAVFGQDLHRVPTRRSVEAIT